MHTSYLKDARTMEILEGSVNLLQRVLSSVPRPFSSSEVVPETPPEAEEPPPPPPPVARSKVPSPTPPISRLYFQHKMPPLAPHEMRHTARDCDSKSFKCASCGLEIPGMVFFGYDASFCSQSCRCEFLVM
jgi:hypothetical protein